MYKIARFSMIGFYYFRFELAKPSSNWARRFILSIIFYVSLGCYDLMFKIASFWVSFIKQ